MLLTMTSTENRLWTNDGGMLTCAKHGGNYLQSAIAARPQARTHRTPMDRWALMSEADVAAFTAEVGHPPLCETCHPWAQPYQARQCPACEVWVYTAAGPFAEDPPDPTKTLADWLHWERHHLAEAPRSGIGFPFFRYNDTMVRAQVNP